MPGPGYGTAGQRRDPRKRRAEALSERHRIELIEQKSGGVLPTSASWALAGSSISDDKIARAAGRLARQLDIPPIYIFGRKAWKDYIDPALDAGLSISTMRRMAAKQEPAYFEAILSQVIDKEKGGPITELTPPRKVAAVVEQMAPLNGWNIPANEAIGAAMRVVRSGANPKAWGQNLRSLWDFFSGSGLMGQELPDGKGRYDWRWLTAVATFATEQGARLQGAKDILGLLAPAAARGLEEEKRLREIGAMSATQAPSAAGIERATVLPSDIVAAFLKGHADDLEKFNGDALGYAREIERQAALDAQQFENSWFNKFIVKPGGTALDWLNRGFEFTALGIKAGTIDNKVIAAGLLFGDEQTKDAARRLSENSTEDLWRAWQGKAGLAESLERDYGVPRWAGYMAEFGIGWFVDPVLVGGRALAAVRAKRVFPGLLQPLRRGEVVLGESPDLTRWGQRVETFAEAESRSLADAIYSGADDAVIKWTRRWRANWEPRSPWDATYMEMLRRGILRQHPERSAEAIQAIKEGIVAHFTANAPPGSLADELVRGRNALDAQAQRALADAPLQEQLWDDALDVADDLHSQALIGQGEYLLPRRLEIPTRMLPGPRRLGIAISEREGTVARRLTAGTSISPGNLLRYHEAPELWFKRTGRRMRLGSDRTLYYERRAATAGAPGTIARERALDKLSEQMYDEFVESLIKPLGVSKATADQILGDMRHAASRLNQMRTFGVTPAVGLKEGRVGIPLGSAQLRNELAVLDPVEIRRAINQWVGSVRRMRQTFLGAVTDVPELQRAALTLPLSKWLDRRRDILRAIMRVWKMGVVARPAYVSRVVLGDELLRSLATTGSVYERVMAQELGPLGRFVNRSVKYRIGDDVIERPILGAIEREPLADTFWSYRSLNEDLINASIRKEKSLAASYNFGIVEPAARHHPTVWTRALNRDIHFSPGLRHAAEQIGDGPVELERLKDTMRSWARTPDGRTELANIGLAGRGDEWADAASEVVYAYTLNDPNIARAAVLGAVDEDALLAIPLGNRPPIHGPLVETLSRGGYLRKSQERWYGLWVRRPESALNRQPYYRIWKGRAEKAYLDELAAQGIKPTDAMVNAMDQASREFAIAMNRRIMFDFTQQSRIGEMLGWLFPFSQPFMENIAVWGHIITRQNPAVVGWVNRATRLGLATGFIHRDEDTGELVIPETWYAFAAPLLWMFGGPGFASKDRWSLSTRLTSLNLFVSSSVEIGGAGIPVPGIAPWVGTPLQRFFADRDTPDWLGSYLFQFGPASPELAEAAFESFLPRWLQNALGAISPETFAPDAYRSYQGDMVKMQVALGQSPDARAAEGQARWWFATRALFGLVFPGAPITNFPQENLEREWHGYEDRVRDGEMEWEQAYDEFVGNHTDIPYVSLITIGKTAGAKLEDGLPSVRLEPSDYAQRIINSPKFKEFASNPNTAIWAAALMIQAGNPKAHEFDPNAFAQQVTSGRVYYRSAREIIASDEDRRAWDAWRILDTDYDARFEALEARGFDSQSDKYKRLADEKARELEVFKQDYPGWGERYLVPRKDGDGYELVYDSSEQGPQGVHPLILTTAQAVLESKEVKGLPAVEGLDFYMETRQRVMDELSRGGFTGLESSGAEKIKREWEQMRESITERWPEFEPFIRSWFGNDLNYGVKTSGQKLLDKWEQDKPELRDAYTRYESQLQRFIEDRKEARATGETADVSQIYYDQRLFIDQAWRQHGKRFVMAWYNEMSHAEREQYKTSLALRSPETYSRLDWSLMGIKLDNKTSGLLNGYSQANLAIQQWSQEHPDQSPGDFHDNLARWAKQQAQSDKGFRAALDAMDTWGWQAIALGYTKQPGRTGNAWEAVIDFANKIRGAGIRADFHGDDRRMYPPEGRQWWQDARDVLLDYVTELRDWSGGFRAQWDHLASQSDEGLIYWLMPKVYFTTRG